MTPVDHAARHPWEPVVRDKDGHCMACRRLSHAAYRATHREAEAARHVVYRALHPFEGMLRSLTRIR